MLNPASSPVARDHWEIFELIINYYARSHHSSLALLACSRVPLSPLSLGKACGGGSAQPTLVMERDHRRIAVSFIYS